MFNSDLFSTVEIKAYTDKVKIYSYFIARGSSCTELVTS